MSRLPLFFLIGCGFAGAELAAPDAADLTSPRATRVEVSVLEATHAEVDLMLPGEVIGSRDVVLAAGNGGLVERVRVRRGELVKKGQAIVAVDAELYAAQLASAEAQARQANDSYTRQQALGDMASAASLQNAETQALMARAAEQQARARLARASIHAPFEGVVADVYVEAGAHAAPGSALARIVDMDPVRVTLSVADRDVVNLEEDMEVEVRTNAHSGIFHGYISHVGPAADMRTRAFPVEATVPNPEGTLLPGMIAQVHTQRMIAEGAVVVPQDWIVTRRADQGVFVEEDGVAHWREVSLGQVAGDQVVVDSGVELGERVVMVGHRDLKDGDLLVVARVGHCCTGGRPTWKE